ncbi:MAG: glutaminyl-peptide cyclotransferase, partial [Rikenellaceae bacterium]
MKILLYILLFIFSSCIGSSNTKSSTSAKSSVPSVKYYSFVVRNIYPHSTTSYTQGLQYIDSEMWESTGLEGQSRLMKVNIETAETEVIAQILDSEFGEGLTVWGDSVFMITWQNNKAYIFNRTSGEIIDTKKYQGEGWGLTTDGEVLYMSSGTSNITVREPATFKRLREIPVTLNNLPVKYLNELEWIEGKIWANIYTLNQIVIIDPQSGVVESVVALSGILPLEDITEHTDVLNGIAYDAEGKRIFVTGKNWNKL